MGEVHSDQVILANVIEKLVDISQDQTRLLSEHNVLLRVLTEKVSDFAESQAQRTEDAKRYLETTITTTAKLSDTWWRRAVIIIAIVMTLSQALGNGGVLAAASRLFGMAH